MVKFNLSQNSKIEVGKYYKDITNSKNLKKINVYRWDPSLKKNPRVDTFEVEVYSPKLQKLFLHLLQLH